MANKEKAIEILTAELAKETSHYMHRCILKHLIKRVEESAELADEVCLEHKSFDRCVKYVYQAAYDKMALGLKDGKIDQSKCTKLDNGVVAYGDKLDDQFTYDAAEDYYHVDDYKQWKEEKDAESKKEAESRKKKDLSNVKAKENAKKKAVKAVNDASKALAKDPTNEKLANTHAKAVETADKATAEYDKAKAEFDEKYPEASKSEDKPEKKAGKPAEEAENAEVEATEAAETTPEVTEPTEENSASDNVIPFDKVTETKADVISEAEEPAPEMTTITVTDYSAAVCYIAFKNMEDFRAKEHLIDFNVGLHPGDNAVIAYVSNPKGTKQLDCTIDLSDDVVADLQKTFGEKNVFCSKTVVREVEVPVATLKKAN